MTTPDTFHTADSDTSTSNPRKARAGALMAHISCMGGSSHGWVPVDTHSTPVLITVRRLWLAHLPHPHAHDNMNC